MKAINVISIVTLVQAALFILAMFLIESEIKQGVSLIILSIWAAALYICRHINEVKK